MKLSKVLWYQTRLLLDFVLNSTFPPKSASFLGSNPQ